MLKSGLLDDALEEDWGIIPRTIHAIFHQIEQNAREGLEATVMCSYMQIYNEKLYDLLGDKGRLADSLTLREIGTADQREVVVVGLSEYRVTCIDDVMHLLMIGSSNRSVRATEYNEASSRSHAIMRLSLSLQGRKPGDTRTVLRRAKLNLVDLAGSEKWNTNVQMGEGRVKELTAINTSLSALGQCISALTDATRTHIPYRYARP